MSNKIKKVSLIACAALVVVVFGVFYLTVMINTGESPDQFRPQPTVTPAAPDTAGQETGLHPVRENGGGASFKSKLNEMGISLEDQLVKELQKFYGSSISEKSTQASIYEIRNSIIGSHPEGRAFFYKVLKIAFPDYADEIMETLDKLDLYHQWLNENESMLSEMNAEERLVALWKKRIELFGPDAKEIWVDEVLATDARKSKMLDVLDFINEAPDTTVEEKLGIYQDVLQEIYEGSPEEYFLTQKPILAKVFFSIDSVQNELKQMSPDQRQMAINKIRREMGFAQQHVEEMEKRDAERNQRWDVGLKYMEAREKVVSELEGPAPEEKLKALREEYFKDEAKTIELEEADDFFRYERPRYYGRN
jgi:hypothetical protein